MKAAREPKEVRAPDRDGAKDPANGELGPEEIWKEPVKRLLIRLATISAGLDAAEAKSRLTTFGPNGAHPQFKLEGKARALDVGTEVASRAIRKASENVFPAWGYSERQ
jgi:Cation transporter/ATPase, N-terminus